MQNVRAGVLYLKDLQKLFKNNTRLVLAAYNAGENAVLRHKGIPPYDETQNYVRKVMKVHREDAAVQPQAITVASAAAPLPHKLVTAAAPVTSVGAPGFVPVAAAQPVTSTPPEKNL